MLDILAAPLDMICVMNGKLSEPAEAAYLSTRLL